MRLAKLTICGFKSFADKTEFCFDHPVTGVVGPNGCGKSNIVDAIKWVLGERSSKSLRGTEMLDVIFAGSAGRKPGGMASVALTFENPLVDRVVDELSQPVAIAVAGEEADESALVAAAGTTLAVVSNDENVTLAPVPLPSPSSDDISEHAASELDVLVKSDLAGSIATPAVTAAAEESVVDASVRRRRILPIDSDTVEVERRLYRDGESAYLINGKKARLKDIRELFLDTGVGADAYSIIEQGKVDAMLMSTPQERRVIFEEAAGIAKYKQRRVEAQRKLDRAQSNLKSAREELDSTERRLRLVRGQAAKARKFKEMDSELKAWRLALAFEQYDDLEQRILSIVGKHSTLSTQREVAGQNLTQLEQDRQAAELTRQEAYARHKAFEQERMGAVHAEQQATQRRSMLERNISDAQRQVSLDRDRVASGEQRRIEAEKSIAQYRTDLEDLTLRSADAEGRLVSTGEQRAAILEELNDRRQAAQQKFAASTRIDRERVGLLASITSDAKRADSVREQVDRLREKEGRLAGDEQSAQRNITSAREVIATATASVTELEARLAALESQTGKLSADRRERAERVGKLDSEVVRSESRRATLQEMVDSRVGFGEAVRQVLAARDSGKGLFAGVVAPLADLIETRSDADTESAHAVEMALGSDLQGLVVDSIASLPAREDFGSIKGRVTFLPQVMSALGDSARIVEQLAASLGMPVESSHSGSISIGSPAGMQNAVQDGATVTPLGSPTGRVVAVRALVQPRASVGGVSLDVSELLDRLLGRTFLVDDVDAAMMLSAGPLRGQRCRFITRQGGSMIDGDGRVLAGSAGAGDESTGILRRRIELETLQSSIAQLSVQLTSERDALKAVDTEAGAISAQAGQTRTALAQAQRGLLTEQNKLERFLADAQRLGRERNNLHQETQQLTERLTKLEDDRAKLQERADSLGRLQEEEHAAATVLDQEVRTIQARADAAMEQSTAAKIEVSKLAEQLHATRRELGRLESARDDLARQARELETQVQRLEARIGEHAAAIDECAVQMALAQANVVRLTADSATAHSEATRSEDAVAAISIQAVEARNSFSAIEREWHSLELGKRELEVKRENLQERAQEDLQLDLQSEYGEYQQMMAEGDVARIDTSEAALRIDTLRDGVKKLGSVNIEAIGEETTLEQQNDDLVKQVADIDAACAQLAELITRLNDVSRTLFSEVFTRIQKNFGGDSGMFRKLFNGGKAEVRLMPLMKEVEDADGTVRKVETDQIDVLESGVEVIAKPPGKEPRSISQLSGGEKTLTAVALLMSIFRSKPSCFCVLDEVDAALDEGNVGRFNSVVREYTDRSSFIVITHNKRTMQTADRLYGVTMQERGVSTRVAVRFDQVGKDGEIKSTASAENAGTAPPRLAGSERSDLLNSAMDRPEVGVVALVTGEAGEPTPQRKSRSKKSAMVGVVSGAQSDIHPSQPGEPGSLRQALAAMRELASTNESPRTSDN
jgi:chromosome segregation protein